MDSLYQETDTPAKRKHFLNTVKSNTWNSFLYQDAKATRKSFARWWSTQYLKTPKSKSLDKAAKDQVQRFLSVKPPSFINRGSLHPDSLHVIEIWEARPLLEGTSEWNRAKIRWIRDLALDGLSEEEYMSDRLGEYVDAQCLAEARCWLYKDKKGEVQRYRSLPQLWRYKDLMWDPKRDRLVTVMKEPSSLDPPNPRRLVEEPFDAERLRISPATFRRLLRGPRSVQQPESHEGERQRRRDHDSDDSADEEAFLRGPVDAGNGADQDWFVDLAPQDVSRANVLASYTRATEQPIGPSKRSSALGDDEGHALPPPRSYIAVDLDADTDMATEVEDDSESSSEFSLGEGLDAKTKSNLKHMLLL